MSSILRAVALFCDDIRHESAGTQSLVGIFPDNLAISELPGALPRLSIYFRYECDTDNPPKSLRIEVIAPWAEAPIFSNEIPSATIEQGISDSRRDKLPLTGFIASLSMANFPLLESGLILVKVIVDEGEGVICGQLRVSHQEQPALTES